jgi:hypothetical protein
MSNFIIKERENHLLQLRKSMCEVINDRDELLNRLFTYEEWGAYPLSDREEKQGYIDSYIGMKLDDVKHDLLKKISARTSWIEYQKEKIEYKQEVLEVLKSQKEKKEVA